ncbi:MAG: DUF3365 domain-containing protein [Desulfobulbaceae bacterium]|nr:DUF3365 domain-containing protein [Desulfobulbaceae bacterium]
MNFFKNQSIFLKIFSLFFVVTLLFVASHVLVAQKVQREFLRKQASSVSRQIVLTRQWIASLGGVWSKDGYSETHGFLTEYQDASLEDQAAVFYLHNPALATREISSLADIKYGYSFRVVSDRFREPQNKPDLFEKTALQKISQDKRGFYDRFEGKLYRYTEPLLVKKGCLRCHGDLKKDVNEPMRSILLKKYGNSAFGYKVGDVRGIISIKIPREDWETMFASIFDYKNYAILVVAIILFYLFTKFVIVTPITNLTKAAIQLSLGKIDTDLGAQEIDKKTNNEIYQLAMAFERLRQSFRIVVSKFSKK